MTVVWLEGDHDIATVPALGDTLAKAILTDDADLLVDLSAVTFIGVATLHLLSRSASILRAQSRTLRLRSPSPFARRLLELCGLGGLVEASVSVVDGPPR